MIDHRQFLESLFEAAVAAADPSHGIAQYLPKPPQNGRTVVIGAGKGSAQMAAALEALWQGELSGVVVTRYGYGCETKTIEVLEAAHPVPDEAGLKASERLKAAISNFNANDLVIALISGGGSALLPAPPEGCSLADEIAVNEALLRSGAPISAMNVVRKHASTIKGGRLAALTKARVISLIMSDIPGDEPSLVASGPTVPDASTREDALKIIEQYRIDLPEPILTHIRSEAANAPFPSDEIFAGNETYIVGSAAVSLKAAADVARAQGVTPVILSDAIEGEAREIAKMHGAIARQIAKFDEPFKKPVVLLSGGETTVTVRNSKGRGGRNGEFALSLAFELNGFHATGLSADTDGIDGTENNAGAFVDGETISRMRALGVDPDKLLSENLSYEAFLASNDLLVTGPTGVNVNDFRAILIT